MGFQQAQFAISGQVVRFTNHKGRKFRVLGYVLDERDPRPGALRCPTERCGAQCCAEGGFCGHPDVAPAGAHVHIRDAGPGVKIRECTGRCPKLSPDLRCEIYKAIPIGGRNFPISPEDVKAYPRCELRVIPEE